MNKVKFKNTINNRILQESGGALWCICPYTEYTLLFMQSFTKISASH